MKKSIIASVIALGLVGGAAHAANNEVQFVGAVTSETCDLQPETSDGGMITNIVNLGSVKVGETGQPVEFALKPVDATAPGCQAIAVPNKTATVSWASPAFTADGLKAISGAATDAAVLLTAKNSGAAGNADTVINSSTRSVLFPATQITQDGLTFAAQLKAKNAVGDFQSAASFVVAYK
ncbi:fimbrial protein [Yersinia enterocolitica]|uniref:fimbrial protein n=1 Tax=Yersinia enterocolitica TaxID=630 RepID=UPI0029A5E6C1|nr:fimbrial protein [Yersinia enterocolitica]HEI6777226.1 fimbrial protein [Yersinia enterocolitica]HEI6781483.1 fimbrial protein [Yersinia enterocolitica]HEI6785756.1 fimbrial protein [Yersinia enterocolitica]HEI6840753.1 fimbrial protein [Yersinia enterocolitica]